MRVNQLLITLFTLIGRSRRPNGARDKVPIVLSVRVDGLSEQIVEFLGPLAAAARFLRRRLGDTAARAVRSGRAARLRRVGGRVLLLAARLGRLVAALVVVGGGRRLRCCCGRNVGRHRVGIMRVVGRMRRL